MTCEQFGNMQTDNQHCSTCPDANRCAEETLDRTGKLRETYNKATTPRPKAPDNLKCTMNIMGNEVILKIPLEGLIEMWLKLHTRDETHE